MAATPLTQAAEQVPLSPVVMGYVLATGQSAAIGSTSIAGTVPKGIYRTNVVLLVTTAGTSGNLVANILVTDDIQGETIAAATISNIASGGQANGVIAIENTASASINYSTTLSGTAGGLVYQLYIVLERIF